MSIDTRVVPFSRSIRTLIKKRADPAKPIKDLKALSVLHRRAGYRHSGPKGPEENKRRFFRSANDGEGNPLACAWGIRGPKPYDEREALFSPQRGGLAPALSIGTMPS